MAADAAEKIARRDANALAAQKADVTRAAAAAHAAAAFLSGSRFRALLKANEQLRGALATQEAQRAAAAKRVDVQKRADASTRDALETATKRIIAEKSRVAEEALEAMHDARAALGAERVAKDARAVVAEAWLADALVAWDADAAENAAARAALAARVDELAALNAKAESRLENVKRDRDYFRSKVAVAARAEEPPAPLPKSGAWGAAPAGPRPPPGPPPATPPTDGEAPVLVPASCVMMNSTLARVGHGLLRGRDRGDDVGDLGLERRAADEEAVDVRERGELCLRFSHSPSRRTGCGSRRRSC